jgi:hypothetical protein
MLTEATRLALLTDGAKPLTLAPVDDRPGPAGQRRACIVGLGVNGMNIAPTDAVPWRPAWAVVIACFLQVWW